MTKKPAGLPTKQKTPRTVEIHSLNITVSVRVNRKLGVTILDVPNYVWDQTDFSTREVELPGLDLAPDTIRAFVVLMVREFTRGRDEGVRLVHEQWLHMSGLQSTIIKLTNQLEEISTRLEKVEGRR